MEHAHNWRNELLLQPSGTTNWCHRCHKDLAGNIHIMGEGSMPAMYPRNVSGVQYEFADGGRETLRRELTPPPYEASYKPGTIIRDGPIPEGVDIKIGRRASRTDRDRYIALLRQCYADERMTKEEFDRRMELAASAVTEADLKILVDHDLPPFPEPPPPPEPTLRELLHEAAKGLITNPRKIFRELWVQIIGIVLSFAGAVTLAVIPAVALFTPHHHSMAAAVGTLCIIAGIIWCIATVLWTFYVIENN